MKPSEFWDDGRTEREFEECGLQCCTRTQYMGHRCGYVALPKGHPLFGKDYKKCYDIAPELDVDGGITFARGTDDTWILGWDAAHAWHKRDWSIASDNIRKRAEKSPELYADFDWHGGSYMVDADMAENETRRFARQLAKLYGDGKSPSQEKEPVEMRVERRRLAKEDRVEDNSDIWNGNAYDPVERPYHYVKGSIECIDWIEEMLTPEEFIGYLKGCALKYQWRYADKENPVQDLEKAQQYLGFLTDRIRKQQRKGSV